MHNLIQLPYSSRWRMVFVEKGQTLLLIGDNPKSTTRVKIDSGYLVVEEVVQDNYDEGFDQEQDPRTLSDYEIAKLLGK